ncbi:hypothetical protein GN958_ATG15130 [Phytophthora infestans]|uniref:Uncharacterized protein n=1 Tax=Phytophthora infestans TaxID=4787 RepID=A0A8S9U519_PHYIN|nr:hypothetical protein GN958_ATG15130 [Phytophthora infestans]
MKNIGEDGWNGGDSGDIGHTHDIKPLAYQQETPRSATSVQSEKSSQTTAWRPPSLALVSTHVGFEAPDAKTERRLETSLCLGIRSSWNVHDVLADTRITKTAHEVLETANTGTTTTSLS